MNNYIQQLFYHVNMHVNPNKENKALIELYNIMGDNKNFVYKMILSNIDYIDIHFNQLNDINKALYQHDFLRQYNHRINKQIEEIKKSPSLNNFKYKDRIHEYFISICASLRKFAMYKTQKANKEKRKMYRLTSRNIFTKKFYENAFATLATLNTFADNKEKYINEMDMYESGTFLFMSVYDNEENRKILSHVISNIDNYKEYCKKLFIGDDIDNEYIDVSGLVYEFEDIFYGKYNILWDKNAETFYFDEEE